MAFREVRVFEVREVLRLWLRGEGFCSIERLAVVDRKTVRRYVAAGVEAGLVREAGEEQLNDVVIGAVWSGSARTARPVTARRGRLWWPTTTRLRKWLVEEELTVVKAGELLARQGVVVPQRTLHRYALEVLGVGRSARGVTVRVADDEPGGELQVDFGKMGMIVDPDTGRRRVVWALILTACYSRHTFVWLTHRQTTEDVIAGWRRRGCSSVACSPW